MRLPDTAHTSRPWRIHELARDFRLEDVWSLPTPGGPDDFPRLVQLIASGEATRDANGAAGALWVIRRKLGELFGWDEGPDATPAAQRPSLRDRLPADLRAVPSGPQTTAPFTPVYLTADEWAAEIINRTVHGILHLGWVPDRPDLPDHPVRYHGQLAVYAKPNGLLGTTYMAAITPFRHLIVYPPMIQQIGRAWSVAAPDQPGPGKIPASG
jgi:Protein of unknown function (DUF2867)